MEFKGTKGEWVVCDSAMTVSTTADIEGNIICDAPTAWDESMENWESNAKLIAAAPDLLEALQNLLDLCDTEDSHGRLVVKDNKKAAARKAISKALESE
jgi:hypothetical protein